MVNLWTLGGLSWLELLRRTWRESWEDEVFGQAARLAFYHFIGLFPSLLLVLILLSRLEHFGSDLLGILKSSFQTILPPGPSGMVTGIIAELGARARGTLWFASLGAMWAAFNGTGAVMSGLNDAYEVQEERPWWKVTLVAGGLTIALAVLGFAALVILLYGRSTGGHLVIAWQIVHCPVLAAMPFAAFTLLYRFGPNLHDGRIRWSTPGAVVAVTMGRQSINFFEISRRFGRGGAI